MYLSLFPSYVLPDCEEWKADTGQVEHEILRLLNESGGEMYQSELVLQSGFSRSRVSEVLSSLESRGLVSRSSLGKNLRISLKARSGKGINFIGDKSGRSLLRLGFTRAAEYPFIIPFKKLLRDKLDLDLDLRIYENGLDVARDISLLKLDLGIAPVLSEFMLCSLGAPMKIIAPAGSGGSSVVERRNASHSPDNPRIASTKLSTMELLMKSSVREHFLPDESMVVYSSGPADIMKSLASKRVDAACIWEPYATMLTRRHEDFAKLVDYSEIGDHLCCALSAGNHLSDRVVRKISRLFGESLSEFRKDPESHIRAYSTLIKFDEKIMREVAVNYSYPSELEPDLIAKQFDRAGIQVPSPSSIRTAIYDF